MNMMDIDLSKLRFFHSASVSPAIIGCVLKTAKLKTICLQYLRETFIDTVIQNVISSQRSLESLCIETDKNNFDEITKAVESALNSTKKRRRKKFVFALKLEKVKIGNAKKFMKGIGGILRVLNASNIGKFRVIWKSDIGSMENTAMREAVNDFIDSSSNFNL